MFQSLTHHDNPHPSPSGGGLGWGRPLRWLPAALFVVAVPVFLVTGSIAWAFNNIGLYEGGFEKYRIAWVSGITPEDLRQVALDLRAYFNSGDEPLSVRTRIFGTERELFNAKEEVHHMYGTSNACCGASMGAFAVSVVCLAGVDVGGVRADQGERVAAFRRFSRRALWGGGLTVAAAGAIRYRGCPWWPSTRCSCCSTGSVLLMIYGSLTRRTDYLVLLFPQGFWFDATMWVALRAMAGGGADIGCERAGLPGVAEVGTSPVGSGGLNQDFQD